MNILKIVAGIIKPLFDGIDSLTTTEEERLHFKNLAEQMQHEFAMQMYDYQLKLLQSQTDIITAEANSKSFLARSWRPITMLTFLAMIVYEFLSPVFGLPSSSVPAETMTLIKIGLGGYTVGRSGEKIAAVITKGKVDMANGNGNAH